VGHCPGGGATLNEDRFLAFFQYLFYNEYYSYDIQKGLSIVPRVVDREWRGGGVGAVVRGYLRSGATGHT
jgi:hypothetical protein